MERNRRRAKGRWRRTVCAFVGVHWPMLAVAQVALPPPGDAAWKAQEFPKIAAHTRYEVVDAGGVSAFEAVADCSASAMTVPASSIDLQATPMLRWRWRVDQGLDIADERTKAGDDFAARVYVMFRFDSENASVWRRAKQAIAELVYGEEIPGYAISYVWASRAPVGSSWKNPYSDASQMIVKQTGPADGWLRETANVAADYLAGFGEKPPPVVGVAVMTDADDTCQKAKAYFADIEFVGP